MKEKTVLPQLSGTVFLTDGGIETSLIFRQGIDLPLFAAFDLLKSETGTETLRQYFRTYAMIAKRHQTGFILESATWRASADWAAELGYSAEALAQMNRKAIEILKPIQDEFHTAQTPVIISGCVGPRGDGYNPKAWMTPDEARQYHSFQINTFRQAGVDMICAATMTYPEEAIGITRAARAADLPVAISFTVETDGRLPNQQSLQEAIEQVDQATQDGPAYYMINCAHPSHFAHVLTKGAAWVKKIRGLRANASRKSHAELNESATLDDGDPKELGAQYRDIRSFLPHLNILGGCCGTDDRHISAIAETCARNEK